MDFNFTNEITNENCLDFNMILSFSVFHNWQYKTGPIRILLFKFHFFHVSNVKCYPIILSILKTLQWKLICDSPRSNNFEADPLIDVTKVFYFSKICAVIFWCLRSLSFRIVSALRMGTYSLINYTGYASNQWMNNTISLSVNC